MNPSLTRLDLQSNLIGDTGVAALAHALSYAASSRSCGWPHAAASITTLNLFQNRIGSDGAACLAHALFFNRSLTRLDLDKNQIGPAGAAALADALMVNAEYVLQTKIHNHQLVVDSILIGLSVLSLPHREISCLTAILLIDCSLNL